MSKSLLLAVEHFGELGETRWVCADAESLLTEGNRLITLCRRFGLLRVCVPWASFTVTPAQVEHLFETPDQYRLRYLKPVVIPNKRVPELVLGSSNFHHLEVIFCVTILDEQPLFYFEAANEYDEDRMATFRSAMFLPQFLKEILGREEQTVLG